MNKILSIICLLALGIIGCEDPLVPVAKDNFNRTAMLESWVDQSIKPSYAKYLSLALELKSAHAAFQLQASAESLEELRAAYIEAYKTWQSVSLYEIGKAEKLRLRTYTNTFPTNEANIESNIELGNVNLELPSTRSAQGFPALDYILYENINEEGILGVLSSGNRSQYLESLINRLVFLAEEVNDGWDADARADFVANPESVDRMVNDFIFYYEKFLRAGKVGIPAGVFSGDPLPGHAEAPYSESHSRIFLLESLNSLQAFFNANNSLSTYLEFMDKRDIADRINTHWNTAKEKITQLEPDLKTQVLSDNMKMLEVYDELQKAVILLKVDMLQALSIQVDYVDADGD